jgi:hypothetical protein
MLWLGSAGAGQWQWQWQCCGAAPLGTAGRPAGWLVGPELCGEAGCPALGGGVVAVPLRH